MPNSKIDSWNPLIPLPDTYPLRFFDHSDTPINALLCISSRADSSSVRSAMRHSASKLKHTMILKTRYLSTTQIPVNYSVVHFLIVDHSFEARKAIRLDSQSQSAISVNPAPLLGPSPFTFTFTFTLHFTLHFIPPPVSYPVASTTHRPPNFTAAVSCPREPAVPLLTTLLNTPECAAVLAYLEKIERSECVLWCSVLLSSPW